MYWLKIVVTVLVFGPHGHKPTTDHHTVNLAFLSRHTCEVAQEDQISTDDILTIANASFKATHTRKWALKATADCVPETNGQEPSDHWTNDNWMFRS